MIFAIQDGAVQLLLCRVRENQGLPSLFSKVGKFHLLDNEELDGYLLSFFEVYYLMSYIYISLYGYVEEEIWWPRLSMNST